MEIKELTESQRNELEVLVKTLHAARLFASHRAIHINRIRKEAMEEWDSAHRLEITESESAWESVNELDKQLREFELRLYQETGQKTLGYGCVVKKSEVFVYDKDKGLEWAKEKATFAVKPETLDEKKFEKLCVDEDVRPGFVKIEEKLTATVPTDFGKYLE